VVKLAHGDLEDALEHLPHRPSGFMPELLKAVMTSVPFTAVEQLHSG